ncbi:MAG: YbbR-like domain-containing protein [Candidatus Delongbacteria bacterium]|nr:YbbR-like domain-containing protein [Candidatus Delongbacteria bacterium]
MKINPIVQVIKYIYASFRKDIRTKFIFFIIGIILWLNINLEKDFETNIVVPIKVTNLPSNKTLLHPIPQLAKIKVRSKGKSLVMTDIKNSLYFEIDLSSNKDTVIQRLNSDLFVNLTSKELEPLFIFYPQEVVVVLDDLLKKKVPVKCNTKYTLAPGYVFSGKFKQDPDSIIISGPEEKVRLINNVQTKLDISEQLTTDYSKNVNLILRDTNSIKYSRKTVSLFHRIVRKGFYTFKVPVKIVNKQLNQNVIVNPVAVEIEISGPVNELQKINSKDFVILADLNNIDEISETVPLTIETGIELEWIAKTKVAKIIKY